MSARKKLDAQTEVQVVAKLARGDTHQEIVDWLKDEKDIDFSVPSITVVKKRNEQALDFMKTQLVEHQTTLATQLLDKSRRLIDQRLNDALNIDEKLKMLNEMRNNEEIDAKEYWNAYDSIMRDRLTIKDLNSVSKEAFNQSQLEAGKPTSIAENPAQAKENLKTLLQAINDRDDEAALKAIFIDD